MFSYTWGLHPTQRTLLEFFLQPFSCGLQGNAHVSHTAVTRVEVLSCSFLSHRGLRGGSSTSSLDVQESQCPQLVIELCRSTHGRGIICADSCGIRLETLASADALPPLPRPPPLSVSPLGDPAYPAGTLIERLSGCALAAACPHLVFSQ